MLNLGHYFALLLERIEPSTNRKDLCSVLPGQLRGWLKDHDYDTASPHTRLSGSYKRQTAICDIKDVDTLLFLPHDSYDESPQKVIRRLRDLLATYPNARVEATSQRRSVRVELLDHSLDLDVVPVIAPNGLDQPLLIADKAQQQWIDSDPLGYGKRLSALNQDHNERVVPLVKLVKAWRDVHMIQRRPKSFVLEVIVVCAVENSAIILEDRSTAQNVASLFSHIVTKYRRCMDEGSTSPRIADPQIPTSFITKGWDRSHFETFMRRVREADKTAQAALLEVDVEKASEKWKTIFADLWPTKAEAVERATAEAATISPGQTGVGSTGLVIGNSSPTNPSIGTRYHGQKP